MQVREGLFCIYRVGRANGAPKKIGKVSHLRRESQRESGNLKDKGDFTK